MANEFEKWLQSRLTSHGYPVGLIDGIVGDVTTRALKQFQASRGIEPTGTATGETVTALRATSTGPVFIPTAPPAAPLPASKVWPLERDVPKFYGPVGESQTKIELPFDMYLAWDKGQRLRVMTLHKNVAASALTALQEVANTYTAAERKALGIDLFGGSLNVRKKRGGTSYSMHSWGIAIDFDPERNALNTKSPQARLSHADAVPFWRAWEREGWLSLGRSRNYDWMHVQAARL